MSYSNQFNAKTMGKDCCRFCEEQSYTKLGRDVFVFFGLRWIVEIKKKCL